MEDFNELLPDKIRAFNFKFVCFFQSVWLCWLCNPVWHMARCLIIAWRGYYIFTINITMFLIRPSVQYFCTILLSCLWKIFIIAMSVIIFEIRICWVCDQDHFRSLPRGWSSVYKSKFGNHAQQEAKVSLCTRRAYGIHTSCTYVLNI